MEMNYDLVIKNGMVVLPDKISKKDIGIYNEKIVSIEENIDPGNATMEDAKGLYVFPGMIDVHVHFNDPGREEWEGFESGSAMMAAGGCTTFFDMPLNGIPSTTTVKALHEKAQIAHKKSATDFGLWGGLVPGNIAELAPLAQSGVVGFKAFISTSGNEEFEASDDETLFYGMQEIAKLDKVLALHAESRTITDILLKQKLHNKQYSADDYAETRPIVAEVEAVERALAYAEITACPLHFVHISSARAVEKITNAKKKGVQVTLETCPHYLLFSHQDLVEKGSVAKCAPPLRDMEEKQKLIQLLKEDKIDIIASDHSPAPFALKDPEKHHLLHAWGGISGGQFSLIAMIELAVTHDIPFHLVSKWTALNPARRFQLSSKGAIKEGLDADITLVDLNATTTVTPESFLAKHKKSLYMDHTFPCRVTKTYNRGSIVYDDRSKILDKMTKGQWMKPE
ncbi:allantoinase [Aquibacillus koreensis]|uniref:Allantoinase n=1 Tax=Aquibacillus koreensis TaxID=279446 RepID=A0A9X3WLX2_9BACI|nr:allantoinase [Aquibacillus koreensis]MCT2537782.1 allantoinase [Aquibacillus koreensis]MDC3421185.1 allantoinase [Aquibacillus koreensis]